MAEGLLRHLAPERTEVFSAGTAPRGLNPLAVQVMAEIGIDITHQRSKSVDEYVDKEFDYVITLCDEANEACPTFPFAKHRLHWGFKDPARVTGSNEERLKAFQRIRDEIQAALQDFIASTPGP